MIHDNAFSFFNGCAVLYDVPIEPFLPCFGTPLYISHNSIYSFSPTEENHQGVL
jgi:hypothetical protein